MIERKKNFQRQEGLSLIEVLVALTIASLLLFSVNFVTDSDRDKLDDSLENIERAIRFAQDEAVLRGSIVRVHFKLDEDPQSFSLQAGPTGEFILPATSDDNKGGAGLGPGKNQLSQLSLDEQEKKLKAEKSISLQFSTIKEFSDGPKKLPQAVRVLAVATGLREEVVRDGEANIYVFPSGEKDPTLVILSTYQEMAAVMVDPYTNTFERDYKILEGEDEAQLIEQQESMVKELYEKWNNR